MQKSVCSRSRRILTVFFSLKDRMCFFLCVTQTLPFSSVSLFLVWLSCCEHRLIALSLCFSEPSWFELNRISATRELQPPNVSPHALQHHGNWGTILIMTAFYPLPRIPQIQLTYDGQRNNDLLYVHQFWDSLHLQTPSSNTLTSVLPTVISFLQYCKRVSSTANKTLNRWISNSSCVMYIFYLLTYRRHDWPSIPPLHLKSLPLLCMNLDNIGRW